jgi:outer membrane lipoprotein-sorting protein
MNYFGNLLNAGMTLALALLLDGFSTSAFAADSTETNLALKPVTDPRPILEDLQHKMASVRTVYLEFTQERLLKLFNEPLKSEGVMLIEKPDQIRWETTSPYESILLGNHKSVAQFESEDGKWNKLKLGFPQLLRRVMEQMVLMQQGKVDALTSDFDVSVATGSLVVLTLSPKDETVRSMLSSLEIRLAADLSATREVIMHEPSGELTRIHFNLERRDMTFPAGSFDQSKPTNIAAVKSAVGRGP